jgi:anti-sigma regulatory factor (Ser/Thr protein kinase)
VARLVVAWGHEPLLDVAELCTSELVTNAICHANGHDAAVTVTAAQLPAGLRVEVHDDDPAHLPELQHPAADRIGGRGVLLVDLLSDRWGCTPNGDGKWVWFELRSDRNDDAMG